MEERVHKVLARAGVASRRVVERLVREGRVTINGEVVRVVGARVDPERDLLVVDGRRVRAAEPRRYVLLHKPPGFVSSARDERGRATVLNLVRHRGRLYPVGRLDADSEGLMILTDDGSLAYKLTHPRHAVPKEYHVLVRGPVTAASLARLRAGIDLAEGRTAPAVVEPLGQDAGQTWLRIVLRQGWKRQIRRMLAAVGHPVERLIRTGIGGLTLGDLAPGQARVLSSAEVGRALEGSVQRPIIALDGPAGAGKSAVGALLAARLGWLFVDTGVFYRALTWVAIQRGIAADDEIRLAKLARGLDVHIRAPSVTDGRALDILVGGEDVTMALRAPAVDHAVSVVAALPAVRRALSEPQRAAVGEREAVVAGRDIGTIIFPDAGLKVFLDASAVERARRRRAQLAEQGVAVGVDNVLAALVRRDTLDSSRASAPLAIAADAERLATDGLLVEEVVARIEALWRRRAGPAS